MLNACCSTEGMDPNQFSYTGYTREDESRQRDNRDNRISREQRSAITELYIRLASISRALFEYFVIISLGIIIN
jgi:hypothetical protein